jgi:hypothetical protein
LFLLPPLDIWSAACHLASWRDILKFLWSSSMV